MTTVNNYTYKDFYNPELPGPKLEINKTYTGALDRIVPFGFFVRFGNNNIGYCQGLVHISKISDQKDFNIYNMKFLVNKPIDVKVLNITIGKHISLRTYPNKILIQV